MPSSFSAGRSAQQLVDGYTHLFDNGPSEPSTDDDEGLDLPINPDESIPLIPDDDDRVINVPS